MSRIRGRLLHLCAVLLGSTVLTFSLLELLPGDAAVSILGYGATPEDLSALRGELRLDDPWPARYGRWLAGVLQGDLGRSLHTGESVARAIMARLPVSIELMVMAQLVAVALGFAAGIGAASRLGGRVDSSVRAGAALLMSLPSYVMAVGLIAIFAVRLGWLPATGYTPASQGLFDNLRSLLLPALSLGLVEAAVLTRLLRGELSETLGQRFIALARAKGLPERRVLAVHALKLSMFSSLTVFGLQVGNLIGGAVVVETIFALPGVGRLLVDAIHARDIVMVQGIVLFIAVAYVLVNLAIDLGYFLLDPRIRRHGPPA